MLKQNRTKELGGELRDQFGATLKELVEQDAMIYSDVFGSDHCPVGVLLRGL